MLVIGFLAHLQACVLRFKTRKALKTMTREQGIDIGVTPEEQRLEANKASVKGFLQDLFQHQMD
ncbi:hypothetical protein [Marinomonas posidonica]|uniref:Uncharacterized protein n=1 Tax=Marinomonas posidonica (strain CECT 7376 / NCIMB 14433 / IVIA-Po-181) TaxID=491952 RepID=F6CVJ8_MARPP|nr:hypothetical protein [Marinomonas posidonica]AEF55375.1 hypothetical protein Mar181_2340 [Marinomonas posidonica IVIA-Po-181]